MSIYDVLSQFASVSGSALESKVKSLLSYNGPAGDNVRRYIMAVLDPSITYGQKGKVAWGGGQCEWDEGCYTLLNNLSGVGVDRRLSGNAAKTALMNFGQHYSQIAVDLLNRALDKELKCGVGIKTINQLGLDFHIPVFTCALAKPFEAKRIKPGSNWLGSIKFDGMRSLAVVRDNSATFFTRSGNEIPALNHLEPQVLEVFGGRHLVVDAEGVGVDFLDSIGQLRRTVNIESLKSTTILQCFDIIPFDLFNDTRGGDVVGAALEDRLLELQAYFRGNEPENVRYLSHTSFGDDATAMLAMGDAWMDAGFEGGVFKNAASRYSKKRSADWLKIKQTDPATVEITAVYAGHAGGQFENSLGGVMVSLDGVPSDVGGGWSVYERAAIWAAHSGRAVTYTAIEQDKATGLRVITEHVAQPDPKNYVIGRLIDVEFNGRMPSGALRHARKKAFRDLVTSPGVIA
jgi:ATP-dependent DNA ligase